MVLMVLTSQVSLSQSTSLMICYSNQIRKPVARQLGSQVGNLSMYVYIFCMIGNTNYLSNSKVVVDHRFPCHTSCNNAWYILYHLIMFYETLFDTWKKNVLRLIHSFFQLATQVRQIGLFVILAQLFFFVGYRYTCCQRVE